MERPTYNLESWLRVWNGRPCLILGRGRSTFDIPLADIDRFKEAGGKVIIITELGDTEEYRRRADAWVFLDRPTIEKCHESMAKFPGVLWTQATVWRETHPDLVGPLSWVSVTRQNYQFNPDGETVNAGCSTAFVAAQLAWYAGCDPIWFAGIDLLVLPGERTHGDKQEAQANREHFQRVLLRQWPSFDHMAQWIGVHAFNRRVYKTADYSLLPFETRPIG